MLAEERKRKILDMVNMQKIVKVNELSQILDTTEVTIRKDLDDLQAQKLLRRIHGGAISFAPAVTSDLSVKKFTTQCIREKKVIAKLAYKFVDNRDALILDRSTTVYEFAKLLLEGNIRELIIITNSLPLISLLKPRKDFQLILIGGEYNASADCSYGTLTNLMFSNIRSDKCFTGISGIDSSYGYSDRNLNDSGLKKIMLNSAKQKFILADHTKFNESYIGKAADFVGCIDYLITDTMPPNIDRSEYENNVNFLIADEFTPANE